MITKCAPAGPDSLDLIAEQAFLPAATASPIPPDADPLGSTRTNGVSNCSPEPQDSHHSPDGSPYPETTAAPTAKASSSSNSNGGFKPQPQSASTSFHGMAGRSPAMRRFFSQIQTTAPYLRLATLEGEDGTGKTLAARTLHALGPFAKAPFLPCLASVFLAEEYASLALPWCPSLLAQAAGGMLFLDRVDDLDAQQQARLFAFLLWFDHQQARSASAPQPQTLFQTPRQVVVSSTSSLRRMAAADAIRGDLCSRLTAIRLLLPPLRERREDIPLLAQFFVQRFSQTFRKPVRGLAPEALPPLLRYAWPGNVRELESVISSAALQTESQWIRSIDLPPLTTPATPEAQLVENDFNLDRVIARHIERTLERTRGNKLRAASILGISRSTLYRILGSH